ncbi:MAG: hypothetical protein IJ733_11470 [Lachnospiraceae bacterium]|nr:hypothetical protein [Lachnospiraceae bacterium]
MGKRESIERIKAQEMHRKSLIGEAVGGQTKLDTLPNTAQPLYGEMEAMYFKSIRNFFRNNIFRSIIDRPQDLYEER